MIEAKARVLCVDDHPFVAEGLRARLSSEPDLEFAGWIPSAENLIDQVRASGATLVIVDIEMEGPDPFDAVEDLGRQFPQVRAVMFSGHVRDHYIDQAARCGAWGYLSKNDDPQTIVEALRGVRAGRFVFGEQIRQRCTDGHGAKAGSRLRSLTPRELQVLRLMGRGMTRSAIADTMHRSPKTIDTHRMSIMEKLDIHDRGELVRYAIREGVAEA